MNKNTFSKNFNMLVQKNNIKYTELSKVTGIRADKLSKFSNPQLDVQPSVDDLIALSNYFNISIDAIIGNTASNESATIENMADIIKLLLQVSKVTDIRFAKHQFEGEGDNENTGIFFSNKYLSAFLYEWGKITESLEDNSYKDKLLGLWEKEKLNDPSCLGLKAKHRFSTVTDLFKGYVDDISLPFVDFNPGSNVWDFLTKLDIGELEEIKKYAAENTITSNESERWEEIETIIAKLIK